MVEALNPQESDVVAKALGQVETRTAAVVRVVIRPVSDTYWRYVLLDTFLFAGLINSALWLGNHYWGSALTHTLLSDGWFSVALWFSDLGGHAERLLILQLAMMVIVVIPSYQQWVVSLLPYVIRQYYASHSAVTVFHQLLSDMPTNKHVVLLYVSLAERYIHILHSNSLNDTIDKAVWPNIVAHFTKVLPTTGLPEATLQAIKNIESALST